MEQQLNVNDKEIELIKATFSENEYLLKAMRALFLNLGVSDEDKELMKNTFANEELMKIIEKRFYPVLSKETPIGQVQDNWLGVEQMIFDRPLDTIAQAVQYKDMALKMTRKALDLLKDPDGEKLDIEYVLDNDDKLQVKLLARNQFVRHIESQLLFLLVIAGKKDESSQEAKKRLTQDSTK